MNETGPEFIKENRTVKFIFFNSDIPGIKFRLIAFVKDYKSQILVFT
jgi:hypothetical protein